MDVNRSIFYTGMICLMLALLSVISASPTHASKLSTTNNKDKSITKSYNLALARHHNLEYSPTMAKDRENWLLCAKALKRTYAIDPTHQSAPITLFTRGEIFRQMFNKFGNKDDLNEALSDYDKVANLYPQHEFADDALYHNAKFHTDELKDAKTATLILAKLIAIYPKGDRAEPAVKALKDLKASLTKANAAPPSPDPPQAVAPSPQPPPKPAPTTTIGGPIEVVGLRHWSTKNYTRVVIETSAPVSYQGHLLKKNNDNPKRLYVDLSKCAISRDLQQSLPIKDGLLQQMRSAQFSTDTVRVVLDAHAIADYQIFNLENPFRIIVDVKGSSNGKAVTKTASSNTQKKTPRNQAKTQINVPPPPLIASIPGAPSLAQQLGLGIKRIVLDPGHGGKDPGAIGIGGLKEKDVVLNVAQKIARKISSQLGIEVVLTRNSDVFIPLEERTAIANTKNGDLFISIHANAAPRPQAQGIETYYLDFAGNEEARSIAALENASSSRQISDLQNILSKLMQNSKKDESARLAGTVQNTLVSGLCRLYPQVNNHGVKTAPFIVLIGAQMPSILIEVAFLTNPLEAERLKSDKYLEDLADHITAGISNYSSSLAMARL
ncbi:MAG: N-acetylmuramoyl-L-alanine amidase [Proteobacteria bacterium]|nr:AMIN domain-containing protein [Desulfobulbaceae bacterium]MBU4154279.1 N-acetylmuramoyl-L-alanine amidase [Pseudomonadota bacterium]